MAKHVFTLTTLYLILAVYFNQSSFFETRTVPEYETLYAGSQYIRGETKEVTLGDGDLYVYAGIKYLDGTDPTKINFEHPPLGKMLFGASYLLTGYPNLIIIPLVYLFVWMVWQLSGEVTSNRKLRFLSLLLVMAHTTFTKEITRTMLDFPLAFFTLSVVFASVKMVKHPSIGPALLFGLSAGCLLAVKYPLPNSFLLILMFLGSFLWLRVPKKLIGVSIVTTVILYLLTYSAFFSQHQTLVDFARFEWWRWQWFQGKTDNPGLLLLQVIFLGRYPAWWNPGQIVYFPHWNLFWPASLLLYLFSWYKNSISPKHPLFVYKLWVLLAFMISLVGVYEDRFLLPFIPAFALFGVEAVDKLLKRPRL
jgi:hypothetical protein